MTRKIHQQINDAVETLSFGSEKEIKISANVKVGKKDDGTLYLWYFSECAGYKSGEGYIIKQNQWLSQTAMGYYRAFFDLDREELGIKKGELIKPDWLQIRER